MEAETIKVTFDSNVWEEIVLPEKLAIHESKSDLEVIKSGITSNIVKPYISDVIFILESVTKLDRARFLQSFSLTRKIEDKGYKGMVDGLSAYETAITLTADFDHPGLNAPVTKAFKAARALGFQIIKVNRVAFPMLPLELYVPIEEANGGGKDLLEEFRKLNLGCAKAERLSQEYKRAHPEASNYPNVVAFALDERNPISDLVGEWADGDALIAHYEHGLDYFCTFDRGQKAGAGSVLHESRREWLKEEFGIIVVLPAELAEIVNKRLCVV